jgi:hypothetical protein
MRSSLAQLARVTSIALLISGIALSPSAVAKVTCAHRLDAESRTLAGMPEAPEPGVPYRTSVVTSTKYTVNPEPLLLLVRCEGHEDRQFLQLTPEESGGGAVRSTFVVEFEQSGKWLGALMDRGGRFFTVGPYVVAAPAGPASGSRANAGGSDAGLVVGGAAALGILAGVALLGRSRLRDA